jgi:hypothetical protein
MSWSGSAAAKYSRLSCLWVHEGVLDVVIRGADVIAEIAIFAGDMCSAFCT